MSQIAVLSGSSTAMGTVATLTGDTGGAVPPTLGNINIPTGVGLTTTGTIGTSTILITQDGANEGTTSTIGAVTGDVITIALGATPATYTFEAKVSGFESTTPASAGYQVFGTVRTSGVAATVVGTPDFVVNEDAALVTADIDLIASANNAIFRVTGVAGLTINWRAFSLYTKAT